MTSRIFIFLVSNFQFSCRKPVRNLQDLILPSLELSVPTNGCKGFCKKSERFGLKVLLILQILEPKGSLSCRRLLEICKKSERFGLKVLLILQILEPLRFSQDFQSKSCRFLKDYPFSFPDLFQIS